MGVRLLLVLQVRLLRTTVGRMSEVIEESYWDARDVARFLKTSRSWVYGMAERGLLPRYKFGGLLHFLPSEIRAWAAAQKVPSGKILTAAK